MLILTRKTGQAICIGQEITVVITEIEGNQVKIGIEAPKSLAVLRKELLEAVEEENTAAAKIAADISLLLEKMRAEK